MRKLFQLLLFIIFIISLLLTSNKVNAQVGIFPSLFTIPDPPTEDDAIYLVAKGCPAKSQVKFTWKKSGGNTHTREVTADPYGVASYLHDAGYSKADYYDLSVECLSDGRKTSTRFTPIVKPNPGYDITPPSLTQEIACRYVASTDFSNYIYASSQSCNASLTRLLTTIGDHWYIGGTSACQEQRLIPPIKFEGITYYPTKQRCEEILAAQQPKRYIIFLIPGGSAICQEDPNGPYSWEECISAIAQEYVFIISPVDPRNPSCVQKKITDVVSGQETYPTREECEQALKNQMEWDYDWPPNPSQPCFQTIAGRFESETVCWAALCDRIEEESPLIIKIGFEEFCKNAGKELSISTPSPPPPHCEGELVNGRCTAVNTAIGILSTNPGEFVNDLIRFLIGISGGIAVLLIIYAGYVLMTSQGNPEQIQKAKNILTGVIAGLLFLIFSILILEIITVDILRIPGFS